MRRFAAAASSEAPPARPRRLFQVDSLLQQELGRLFARLVEPPAGALVSISSVTVGRDLESAQVGLSILPFARRQEVLVALRGQLAEVQRQLHQRLRLYRVPKIRWTIDESEERASRVEALLDSPR